MPDCRTLRGLSLVLCILLAAFVWIDVLASSPQGQPTPGPIPDRLLPPVLPENPTQVDLGEEVYYYHCMPCHGDRGQGLTDEWRQVWVEDHQYCWARGCHAGRADDEGFPIPKVIPSVYNLDHFQSVESLFNYLQLTHPPQRPGVLPAEDYWSVTAFILHKNGRTSLDKIIGPSNDNRGDRAGFLSFSSVLIATLILAIALIWQVNRKGNDIAISE